MLTNQTVGLAMGRSQPKVACLVLPFSPRPRTTAFLTPLDRMEIHRWRDHARGLGYDRMVIHDREPGDFSEMGNFLSLYRAGESWSRWVFARKGSVISVWCSLTGADLGEFRNLEAAFQAVLPAPGGLRPSLPEGAEPSVIMHFPPRMRHAASA
jgi:hypothetical protein